MIRALERPEGVSGVTQHARDVRVPGRDAVEARDAYSAMWLDRPYRKGMTADRVLREIISASGIQFDPDITRVFVELLLEETLSREREARRQSAA